MISIDMILKTLRTHRITHSQALAILVAATLIVYAVSVLNGFVIDDELIIVNNPKTITLGSIPDLLFSPDVIKPYYRPLNRISYLFDYQLAGMNPAWYHGVNILIHLGCVLILYLVASRLVNDRFAALIAALLFAVHPVNSESVNFISARNTLLATFFSLASLLTFLRCKERGARLPILSALLFFCGLLSKETGLMLIAVIVYLIFYPLPFFSEKGLRERSYSIVPFLVCTVVYFMMRSRALHDLMGASIPPEGLVSRLAMNLSIIPKYLELLIFPADLTIFHAVPKGGLLSTPWFPVAWIALIAACSLIIRSRNSAALFGLVWCAVNYLPISNIVPIPSDPITERFLYIPVAGFFIIIGVMIAWLRSRDPWRQSLKIVIPVIVVICSAVTINRTLEWKDEYSLYRSAVANDPDSLYAHYNLGTVLRERGNLVDAEREWERALVIDPAHSDSLTQLGTLAAVAGDTRRAFEYYSLALKSPPGRVDPTKAMIHYNLGKIYEKLQQPELALGEYESCIQTVNLNYPEYAPDVGRRIERLRRSLGNAQGN
jgi:protein O-mannosyl-transferase